MNHTIYSLSIPSEVTGKPVVQLFRTEAEAVSELLEQCFGGQEWTQSDLDREIALYFADPDHEAFWEMIAEDSSDYEYYAIQAHEVSL